MQEWWQHPVTKAHRQYLADRALREADVRNIGMDADAAMIGVHAIARRYIADALSEAYTDSPEALFELITEHLASDSTEGGGDA